MKTFFIKSLCRAAALLIGLISFGFMMQSCSIDSDINDEMSEFTTYLSIDKPDFDFGRDWESLSESDKTTFNLAQERMDFTFDENGICTTKWTSNRQVNMSEELFNCFINTIALANEITKELSEIQGFNFPRLKTGGNECKSADYSRRIKNCLIQSIHFVYNEVSYQSMDSWICERGYYIYKSAGNYWGVNSTYTANVLFHFLKGEIFRPPISWSNLTSKCILVLKGLPEHAVVFFRFYDGQVHFNDPSGTIPSKECQCNLNDIAFVFKATGIK
jgi:hypothetical protein